MDLFEAIQKRRTVRQFTSEPVPESVVQKAISHAVLAPNSSNTQTWDFYWVRSSDKKLKLIEACLNQSAARSAQEMIVVVADPLLWKRSQPQIIEFLESIKVPHQVLTYYRKLLPLMYRWGFFNSLALLKMVGVTAAGLFKPVPRTPLTKRDVQEVSIKSAALAAENFVLSLVAEGFDSCMMEGFDECRVKRLLGLGSTARVVMVIGIGKGTQNGTWGPRFRISDEEVIHKV